MSSDKFGRIVRSLRAERYDHDTLAPWTQEKLADVAGMSVATIQNIEQGRRKALESDELATLAQALNLSVLETHEFYAAATEGDVGQVIDADAGDGFDHLWSIFAAVQLPAYLIDSLHELVGVNTAMLTLADYSPELLQHFEESSLGPHVLDILFRPDAPTRRALRSHWERITRASLHRFRVTALRYRYLDRFQQIVDHLHDYPDFPALWQETREGTSGKHSLSSIYAYDDPHHGHLQYTTTLSMTLTAHGPLYLVVLLPLDDDTLGTFVQLSTTNGEPHQLIPWPNLDLSE